MNRSEFQGDILEQYKNRSSSWVRNIQEFRGPRSQTRWKLGPVFAERETFGEDDYFDSYITEVGTTFVATQIEGENPGLQGIAKIRMQ